MWLYPLTVVFSVSQSFLGKYNTRRGGDLPLFNLFKAGIGLAALALIAAALGERVDPRTVVYGGLFGITVFFSMTFGIRAQKTGPMGLSSSLAAFSFVLPVLFGIVFRHEGLSVFRTVGLALGVLSVFLMCNVFGTGQKPSRVWALNISLTFCSNGIGSVIQLLYGEGETVSQASFTATGFAVATVLCALVLCVGKIRGKPCENKRAAVLCGVSCGICFGLTDVLTLTLAVSEGSGLLFAILAVLTLSLSILVGRVAFRERLKPIQLLGVAFALASVFLLKYRF